MKIYLIKNKKKKKKKNSGNLFQVYLYPIPRLPFYQCTKISILYFQFPKLFPGQIFSYKYATLILLIIESTNSMSFPKSNLQKKRDRRNKWYKILFLNFQHVQRLTYIQKCLAPKLRTFLTPLQQIPLITGLPNSLYKMTIFLISFFHTTMFPSCKSNKIFLKNIFNHTHPLGILCFSHRIWWRYKKLLSWNNLAHSCLLLIKPDADAAYCQYKPNKILTRAPRKSFLCQSTTHMEPFFFFSQQETHEEFISE